MTLIENKKKTAQDVTAFGGLILIMILGSIVMVSITGEELNIQGPPDITYEYGTTGNNIRWILTGDNAYMYAIIKEGKVIQNDEWTSPEEVVVNIDGLLVGIHQFTIVAYNTKHAVVSDNVSVTVVL